MSEHTPTPNLGLPWYADQDQREGYEWNVHVVEHNNPNMRVCFMANGPSSVERAAHLVKAVNSHDDLVRALQAAQGQIMNAKIDLQTGHTKAAGIRTLDGIIKFIDDVLASIKESV